MADLIDLGRKKEKLRCKQFVTEGGGSADQCSHHFVTHRKVPY